MPDFLRFDGNPVPIAPSSTVAEREPEIVGDPFVRAFAGNGRSTARAVKRSWGPWQTPPLSHADAAAIRAYAPNPGVPITCDGGFLDGPDGPWTSSVVCSVTLGESPYVPDYAGYPAVPLSFKRVITVSLREI